MGLLAYILEEDGSDLNYVDVFIGYAKKLGRNPFLIMDEANKMITTTRSEDETTADPLLLNLAARTKGSSLLSVLLQAQITPTLRNSGRVAYKKSTV